MAHSWSRATGRTTGRASKQLGGYSAAVEGVHRASVHFERRDTITSHRGQVNGRTSKGFDAR